MEKSGESLMNDITINAINSVKRSNLSFCKFISSNDAGKTGGHQSGFYIPKKCFSLLFDTPGIKGELKDRFVKIRWQDDFETDSRFIYYGQKSRNEYRITKFGRGFPFLKDQFVGDLLVINKFSNEFFEAFVISGDEQIEYFLSGFGISPAETNGFIEKRSSSVSIEISLEKLFGSFLTKLGKSFPDTIQMSDFSRYAFSSLKSLTDSDYKADPDAHIINWIETEYSLFKNVEYHFYNDVIKSPFGSVDELIDFSNSILNRRKSRAGKALENHLSAMFNIFGLPYSSQKNTEGKKKPDFIFPGIKQYHQKKYDYRKLVFLGAKTTCKDRWRQILNEADRIPVKHLFTLQQGISENQLDEMNKHNVILVVPVRYKLCFPINYRSKILSLSEFVKYTERKIQ